VTKATSATDTGVGQAMFSIRIRLTLTAWLMCFLMGFVPIFLIVQFIGFWRMTPLDVDVVKINLIALGAEDSKPSLWRMRDENGGRKFIAARLVDGREFSLLSGDQVKKALSGHESYFYFQMYLLASFLFGALGFLAVWTYFYKHGKASQENSRIRGADDVVERGDLVRQVRSEGGGKPIYTIVDVPLPRKAPTMGTLFFAAPGSGKSLGIKDLSKQVFLAGKKAIIFDPSCEFFASSFRPGKDYFFNPALVGSVPWSIFKELEYAYDSNSLAAAFLPPKDAASSGANGFFEDAARALFSVMLVRLKEQGAVNTKIIADAIFAMPDEEMDQLIEQSVASSAIGGDSKQQRQGVISSIAIFLAGIQSVNEGDWSVREFLNDGTDSRLFLLGTKDTNEMFMPLFRLLLTVSFLSIATKNEVVYEDRYWFFLDEMPMLGDIGIDRHLAELRKYGVCIVAGIQTDAQIVGSIGKMRAQTALSCFGTVLIGRIDDPDVQERAAKRLGKVEQSVVSQNAALAVVESRDGGGLNTQEQEKWSVMPTELGMLPDCVAFLKLVGGYPVSKVDYCSWLKGKNPKVNSFAAVQKMPLRDPRFLVTSNHRALVSSDFDWIKAKNEIPVVTLNPDDIEDPVDEIFVPTGSASQTESHKPNLSGLFKEKRDE
jgi:hypothetical protein